MKITILLLMFLCLLKKIGVESLKNSTTTVTPRIVGGHLADVGQFPFQVGIVHITEGLLCGGTILTEWWILSAAHCFEHNYRGRYDVVVGSVDLTMGKEYTVAMIVMHKNYETDTIENDVSLVKLKTSLIFDSLVSPIKLDHRNIEIVECTAIGWGQTSFYYEKPAMVLNYINLYTIRNSECQDLYMAYAGKDIADSNICTMSMSGGTGTCYMDSGGPLIANGKQIGIVSFGAKCGVYPDVYTRISYFYHWIHDTMQQYN
ncbi:chymotrypsin-1-like [Onthophagus taurus]|uniref:chymotrypsin-1-like n=1 Tax=Onthophagus taurus TaxID=166361 RepID=UPI000C208A5B|nr:chymotrypsin-1-like [Onthophagus taurus]